MRLNVHTLLGTATTSAAAAGIVATVAAAAVAWHGAQSIADEQREIKQVKRHGNNSES